MTKKLRHIMIRIEDRDTVMPVFETICGSNPETSMASDQSARFTRFSLGSSFVELAEPRHRSDSSIGAFLAKSLDSRGPGLHLVGLDTVDSGNNIDDLQQNGIRLIHEGDQVFVHPGSANGVLLHLLSDHNHDDTAHAGDAYLDHVAIRVRDLAAANLRWELLCSSQPIHMGVHPVSNGSFEATRFAMHDQMIELVSPVEGKTSVVGDRLRTHGEGAQTVALIARDLDHTLDRLKGIGIRLIWQDPHWFVHPGDAGGILIQLSPRIDHPS
jgi:catechol 2,3-dioxygenase-like lactoylglutathione lyase family enzyme